MSTTRAPRDPQRGNSLLLALVVMSALGTLGTLTVISVQSSLKTSTNDRAQAIAMYAAESGGAAAMDFLRNHFDPTNGWSSYVRPSNNPIVTLGAPDLPSSGAQPGTADNLFSADQNAWFSVDIVNNPNDPHFGAPSNNDGDAQVIIRATGHGPQGSVAIVEWEVRRTGFPPPPPAPQPPPWPVIAPSVPLILVGWHVVL
jgi:type II secretory pathway pseudopilin PulG